MVAAPGWAVVSGLPEPPRPGPLPVVWLSTTNDLFGAELGDNPDDFRTAGATIGARFGSAWLAQIDYSILTDRAGGGRVDVLTATAGRVLLGDAVGPVRRWWIAAGAGARVTGDLGGEDVQNGAHQLNDVAEVDLAYVDGTRVDGVGWVLASWLWAERSPVPLPAMPFLRRGQLGIGVQAGSLGTTAGVFESHVEARLVAIGQDGAAYLGVRRQWNTGNHPDAVSALVADDEHAATATFGASAGGWFVRGEIALDDGTARGSVGWMWERPPGRPPETELADVSGEIGFYGALMPGVQARWQPAWLHRQEWLGARAEVLVDYRFGVDDSYDAAGDSSVVVRQVLVGLDLGWRLPPPLVQIEPFVQAAIGVRGERIEDDGVVDYPSSLAITGVVQGSLGLRLMLAPPGPSHERVRYGFALVVDGWLPWNQVDVSPSDPADGGAVTLLKSGFTPGIRLVAEVRW